MVFKQQAYTELKRRIIECEYKPGSCINEASLVTDLGFSRTPIREALALIEQEGFI
ncbi:MAG: GntR family transcriptional regulator, partial [Treponema sp.]|nr:GntR family transcriptional regulator [Treponema sp.]